MTLTHVILIVLDVVKHILNTIFDELDGAVAFPVAAQPVPALSAATSS